MTKQVTLTQAQDKAMNLFKKDELTIEDFTKRETNNWKWDKKYNPLKELSVDTFARAYLLPYDVLPNYEVGEDVFINDLGTDNWFQAKVLSVHVDTDYLELEITEKEYSEGKIMMSMYQVRRPTEKEKRLINVARMWSALGRKVGEFLPGDMVKHRGKWHEVIGKDRIGSDATLYPATAEMFYNDQLITGFYPTGTFVSLKTEGTK